MIVLPPTMVATEIGTSIRFTCLSVGQPDPTNHFTHTNLASVTTNVTADGGRILVSVNGSCDCHMTFVHLITNVCVHVNVVLYGSHLVECIIRLSHFLVYDSFVGICTYINVA